MHTLSLAAALMSLGAALIPRTDALTCPGTAGLFRDAAGTPYCCPGIRLTGSVPPTSCSSVGLSGNPFIICRWSVPEGTSLRPGAAGFEADAGSRLYNLQMTVVGGKGDDVAGQAGAYGYQAVLNGNNPVFNSGSGLPAPFRASFLVNIRDGQEVDPTSPSVRGVDYGLGGGYSAVADADCVAGRKSLEFRPGDDCRFVVGSGGGAASKTTPGRFDTCGATGPDSGLSSSSAGKLPCGGGGGILGGGSASALADGAEESTSPGCGGTFGLVTSRNGWFYHTGQGPFRYTPYANLALQARVACEPLVEGDAVVVASTTVIETTSRAVDETTLSGATVTSTIDDVTTVTPPTSSVYTTEDVFTTPPTSVVQTTETSVTTPLTSTVVTDTTLAAGRRTPVATQYVTDTVTTEPPTSVATATQTVPTGFADCMTYRVIYPSTCCPSGLLTLNPAPEQRARRRSVHLEARTLTDNPTLTSGETTTTTTIDYTASVTESDVTVLTTSTEVVKASTPLTTVTESRTLEAPTPLTTSTVVEYSGAPTPLVTTIQTALARGLATSLRAVLFPTLTVSTQTTTTLETPVTTTTVTEEVQSTVCAEQPIRAYSRCPNTGEAGAATRVKSVERARLNGLRAQSGGRSVTVDCGAAGVFVYQACLGSAV